jgi:hypothetical protein
MTLTNHNCVYEEINSRINLGNACDHVLGMTNRNLIQGEIKR